MTLELLAEIEFLKGEVERLKAECVAIRKAALVSLRERCATAAWDAVEYVDWEVATTARDAVIKVPLVTP